MSETVEEQIERAMLGIVHPHPHGGHPQDCSYCNTKQKLIALLTAAQTKNEYWRAQNICLTCGGQPATVGACVYGGMGTAEAERNGLRLACFELESALTAAQKQADEFKEQRDDLSTEMESCHRLLDKHYALDLSTSALDTLEDRLAGLLAEVAAAQVERDEAFERAAERAFAVVNAIDGQPYTTLQKAASVAASIREMRTATAPPVSDDKQVVG